MPKKPRQAHIPQQVAKRRKIVRRSGTATTEYAPDAPSFAGTPMTLPPTAQAPAGNVTTTLPTRPVRSGRRLDLVRTPQTTGGVRVSPGQLPTFERSYLVREMRQILITAGGLLALIIALTFILR